MSLIARSANFDPSRFAEPPSSYRGVPFWAWNGRLERAELLRQIDIFRQMGMGGFHMHARTGLSTPYLSDAFMAEVRACVGHAAQHGLTTWLYDEDRYPSGYAGGLATENPAYRASYLLWLPSWLEDDPGHEFVKPLARYHIRFSRTGYLEQYEHLPPDECSARKDMAWSAWLCMQQPSAWFNHCSYLDTLNPAAVQHFLNLTHERYFAALGEHFGTTIPAIFTDEPEVIHKQMPVFPGDTRALMLPWTDDLPETYAAAYGGADVFASLPEVFWELQGRHSQARYRYHQHVSDRFAHAFVDPVGAWCEQHGVALTGHFMEEQTLASQTAVTGEVMRGYRGMTLPGVDMLCEWRQYNTAKQAQSAAHQFDRPGILAELYGATYYDFTFAQHKQQSDWLAALGVIVRVHHHAWYTMGGEAKRDYPASIHFQSPWWAEYKAVEDHFARLHVALTSGRRIVRIGVIHPIESAWMEYGVVSQTHAEQQAREAAHQALTEWLLFAPLDFDFISESLLADFPEPPASDRFQVGAAAYEVVIVPNLLTIRQTTLERLRRFASHGGKIIVLGSPPRYVDGEQSEAAQALIKAVFTRATALPYERRALLMQLAPLQDVSIETAFNGGSKFITQLRNTAEGERLLFIVNTDENADSDVRIAVRGTWTAHGLNTAGGTSSDVMFGFDLLQNTTLFDADLSAGSALFHLTPEVDPQRAILSVEPEHWAEVARLHAPHTFTLSEPNVFLLDMAEWQVNGEGWQPRTEILQIDRALHTRFGLPLRDGNNAQPWCDPPDPQPISTLQLRFSCESEVAVNGAMLAFEPNPDVQIWWDDQLVPVQDTGWYVDTAIRTLPLPPFGAGRHTLTLSIPFSAATVLEWAYLLGDFGVRVQGDRATMIPLPRTLHYGDWVHQGLPFYGGNVHYHTRFRWNGRGGTSADLQLHIPHFRSPAIRVTVEGRESGLIAFTPHKLRVPALPPGEHDLTLTVYGNRVNTFGALHNANLKWAWFNPAAWRTAGAAWSDEYQLRPMGILAAPILLAPGSGGLAEGEAVWESDASEDRPWEV